MSELPTAEEYDEALQRIRDIVKQLSVDVSHGRRQRLESTVTALTSQLADVATRPDEPLADVVRFTKRFRDDSTYYSYVAQRAGDDGKWYLSCRDKRNDKPHTWDEVLDFVYDRYESEKSLRVATTWEYLIPREKYEVR